MYKTCKNIEEIRRIHDFIRRGRTGTPEEFVARLKMSDMKISRSKLYRILDILKGFGAKIGYDPHLPSYFYAESFEFPISMNLRGMN
jgi:hypothetical protein